MKIYITGCARSGTTLLQRLFYSFKDVRIINNETYLKDFTRINTKGALVAKRFPPAIFSNGLSGEEMLKQVELIKENDIKILNIHRDGRDVIESRRVNCKRWINSIIQMKLDDDVISCNVRYEDLVRKPDKVQGELSRQYGLKINHKFSEYPDFVPHNVFEELDKALGGGNKVTYKARRISTDRIGKNKDLYKEICPQNIISDFEECLGYLSYGL